MDRKNLVRYRKKVAKDLVSVNDAISKDASLSKEEWFDFVFKSSLIGYRSWNLEVYRTFHSQVCKFADAYSEVFMFLVDVCVNGFDNTSYVRLMKRVISQMNKFILKNGKLKVEGFDRNGILFINIIRGNKKIAVFKVNNKSNAINGIMSVTRYCIDSIDSFSHVGEFGKFLIGYLSGELNKIATDTAPHPYVRDKGICTLNDYFTQKGVNYV